MPGEQPWPGWPSTRWLLLLHSAAPAQGDGGQAEARGQTAARQGWLVELPLQQKSAVCYLLTFFRCSSLNSHQVNGNPGGVSQLSAVPSRAGITPFSFAGAGAAELPQQGEAPGSAGSAAGKGSTSPCPSCRAADPAVPLCFNPSLNRRY